MMKLAGDLVPQKILLSNFAMRRILILAPAISTIALLSTIVMSSTYAGLTSYKRCLNDPNSIFATVKIEYDKMD